MSSPPLIIAQNSNSIQDDDVIQPYSENPMYWQYMGEPLMLIGGTDSDNIFQLQYLEEHLDELVDNGDQFERGLYKAL